MNMGFLYPIPKNIKINIAPQEGELAHENFTHCYYALDFLVPNGTKVIAAKAGTVVYVKDDSDEYGAGIAFADKANLIVINQGTTFAEYVHFGKGQVKVRVGDTVKAGDLLGHVGLSGCITEPHLHFNVYMLMANMTTSIPISFVPRKVSKAYLFLQRSLEFFRLNQD